MGQRNCSALRIQYEAMVVKNIEIFFQLLDYSFSAMKLMLIIITQSSTQHIFFCRYFRSQR
jgi:hypothetical protein